MMLLACKDEAESEKPRSKTQGTHGTTSSAPAVEEPCPPVQENAGKT